MTATELTTGPPPGAVTPPAHHGLVGVFLAACRAEWVKLRTVRSTMWSLAVTVLITVGLAALFSAARMSRWDRQPLAQRLLFDPTGFSLNGIFLAQLAIGVLGVLVMSSEYATGQIRATFGAVPQRGVVLLAKVVVFFLVTLVVGEVASFSAFFVGQAIFASKNLQASIGDPGVLRAVLGGGFYLAVIGVFGLGLGAIVRRTAGAIAVLVAVVLILPIIVGFLPSPWGDDISKYLPGPAGNALFHLRAQTASLSPRVGLVVFCAYAVAAVVVGWVLVRRRDA